MTRARRLDALFAAVAPPPTPHDDATAAQHCTQCGAPARWDVNNGLCRTCAALPQPEPAPPPLLSPACAEDQHRECDKAQTWGWGIGCECSHHRMMLPNWTNGRCLDDSPACRATNCDSGTSWSAGRYR